MANEENIRKVIDMIKDESHYFNMRDWSLDELEVEQYNAKYPENICGSPGCIGGWAQAISRAEGFMSEICELHDWFGLTEEEGEALFYPETDTEWRDITREQAIAHLEHIIKTGEVDWKRFVA